MAEERAVYGTITTGLGAWDRLISADRFLQMNLVRSHAVGVGPDLPDDVVRAMMLARANTWQSATPARGHRSCACCSTCSAGIVPASRRRGRWGQR